MWGKENFLKEVFLPPHPYPFKNFQTGFVFGLHCALDGKRERLASPKIKLIKIFAYENLFEVS